MPAVRKVLGQVAPSAATLTTLYTTPASTSAVGSTLVVCNQSPYAAAFRVAVRVAGASITSSQYLFYDVALPGNDTFAATVGMTLATTDVVSVYTSASQVSFTLFGEETT